MIVFDNVSKRFPGGHEALRGLDIEVAKGEMVFVTGHSGAGKSTLLRLLSLRSLLTRTLHTVDSSGQPTSQSSVTWRSVPETCATWKPHRRPINS